MIGLPRLSVAFCLGLAALPAPRGLAWEPARGPREPAVYRASPPEPGLARRARPSQERVNVEVGKAEAQQLDEDASSQAWTCWRKNGCARGAYHEGLRHGPWTMEFEAEPGSWLAQPPCDKFTGPFVCDAEFDQGELDGPCTIVDSQGRPVAAWEFVDGQFEGVAIDYHPSGEKSREVNYVGGRLHGPWQQWDDKGQLIAAREYKDGRQIGKHAERYPSGHKRLEGSMYLPGPVTETRYDWWAAVLEVSVVDEVPEETRFGVWTWWYENGQKQQQGSYENNLPVGCFTWWHSNGQKQREGEFVAGVEQGPWRWWHANGLKQTDGEFDLGKPVGSWVSWDEQGSIVTGKEAYFPALEERMAVLPKAGAAPQSTFPKSVAAPQQAAVPRTAARQQPRPTVSQRPVVSQRPAVEEGPSSMRRDDASQRPATLYDLFKTTTSDRHSSGMAESNRSSQPRPNLFQATPKPRPSPRRY